MKGKILKATFKGISYEVCLGKQEFQSICTRDWYSKNNEIYYSNTITDEVVAKALTAFVHGNQAGFDILMTFFYSSPQQERYLSIAVRVFKDFWNELYNSLAADEVFGRDISSFENVDKKYDFFEDFDIKIK